MHIFACSLSQDVQCIEVNVQRNVELSPDGDGRQYTAYAYAELSKVIRVMVSHVAYSYIVPKPHMATSALTTNARLMRRLKKER
jgi:predicted transcriptional regulator